MPFDAIRCNTMVPKVLTQRFYSVLDMYYDNPTLEKKENVSTLEELRHINKLNPIEDETQAQTDGQTLVRILNRMLMTRPCSPTTSTQSVTSPSAKGDEGQKKKMTTNKKRRRSSRSRSRSRSRDKKSTSMSLPNLSSLASLDTTLTVGEVKPADLMFTNEQMTGLKMRGIPWKTTVQDIEQFF